MLMIVLMVWQMAKIMTMMIRMVATYISLLILVEECEMINLFLLILQTIIALMKMRTKKGITLIKMEEMVDT